MVQFVGVLVGIAVGGAATVALFVLLCFRRSRGIKNEKVKLVLPESNNFHPEPQKKTQAPADRRAALKPRISVPKLFGGNKNNKNDNDDERFNEDSLNESCGEQHSFSTVDYDYGKAYTSAGNSVVSSVGGTQGGNTQDDKLLVSSLHDMEGRAVGLGVMHHNNNSATSSLCDAEESLHNNTNLHNLYGDEFTIFVVQVPAGQKLGMVIHSADRHDGINLPVVHTLKPDSYMRTEGGVQVGDYLLQLDDVTRASGMTALQVSKYIRSHGSDTKTFTWMRRKQPKDATAAAAVDDDESIPTMATTISTTTTTTTGAASSKPSSPEAPAQRDEKPSESDVEAPPTPSEPCPEDES